MVAGRERENWTRALIIASAGMGGKDINPVSMNPYPPLPVPRPAGDDKAEAKEAWANIRAGLKQWVRHGGRRK
jgi:hypothetical protein